MADSIPVFVTARRVVLSEAHRRALFGDDPLTPILPLSQPGEFAAAEVVSVKGKEGSIDDVRVIIRPAPQTRVELSRSDFGLLGLELPPARAMDGSPGCILSGPQGTVVLAEGLLGPHRHLVVSPEQKERLGLDATCSVKLMGDRVRLLEGVAVDVWDGAHTELRIDIDDANAAEVSALSRAAIVEG